MPKYLIAQVVFQVLMHDLLFYEQCFLTFLVIFGMTPWQKLLHFDLSCIIQMHVITNCTNWTVLAAMLTCSTKRCGE